MKIYWRRIKISRSASKKAIKEAKKRASEHPIGELKDLDFTEHNFEWVLLYNHIRIGQLTPRVMRNMKRKDLYYLAGLAFPHPSLARPQEPDREIAGGRVIDIGAEQRWEQLTKIQGNAIRAKEEIRV